MTETEALAAAQAIIDATGKPELDPRSILRAYAECRQTEADLATDSIARVLTKVEKAEAALTDAQQAHDNAVLGATWYQAAADEAVYVRDLFLATLDPEPTTLTVGAHSPTIATQEA